MVGFKCIELIGDDPMYEVLVENGTPKEKLVQLGMVMGARIICIFYILCTHCIHSGYVTKENMKSIISERLKKIKCFMLSYQDKICEKCSLRGDPRYLYYKCHHTPKPYHPKPLEPYHPEPLEEYHPLDTHVIHPGTVQHTHPKPLESYHPEEIIEMEVDDEDNPIFDHPGILTVCSVYSLYTIFMNKGEYITIITGKLCCTKETQKWNCCQKEAKYAKGCRKQYPKKTVLQYPCCKKRKDKEKDIEEKGCDDEFHGGCQERYLCCGQKKGAEVCPADMVHLLLAYTLENFEALREQI